MKIVWLCGFASTELKSFFHTPQVKEFAPWIKNLIEIFRKRKDIELHVVAPNVFTNKQQYVYAKNVHYHFYEYRSNLVPLKINNFLGIELRTNYYFVKERIVKIINNINPDIIHLHGAENPYYSVGILPLMESYPNLVTIQGFVRNSSNRSSFTRKRIQIEEEILERTKHIGVRTKEMSEIALMLNPNAKLHFHNYILKTPNLVKDSNISSAFDIIFFAKVNKDKGIEDLLKALVLVKREKPDVSLHVFGSVRKSYLNYIKNFTIKNNIEENVKFFGFMDTQQDIYKHAINARICVLPTHHDIIPGTIIESMFMKLPVIAYNVGGIPELNQEGQAIVIVEKNDINQLANEISVLLKDKNKRNSLAEHAYTVAQKKFNNSNTVVDDIMKAYNEILSA